VQSRLLHAVNTDSVQIKLASVAFADQAKTLEFYTTVLGFKKENDVTLVISMADRLLAGRSDLVQPPA